MLLRHAAAHRPPPRRSGLTAGRFVTGLGIGASAIVVPAFLAEISPAAHRGAVVQMYEVMLCVGMLAAVLADFLLQVPRRVAAAGAAAAMPALCVRLHCAPAVCCAPASCQPACAVCAC